MVAPPTYFPWHLLWLAIFFVIYYYNWKLASWRKRWNIALAFLLISTAILVPLHFWGMYNLDGIENDGLFVHGFGYWEYSETLNPGEAYKSEALSNLYTIGAVLLETNADSEITFYIQDENIPGVRYEERNISDSGDFFSFRLPYHYSNLYVVANWTMNVFNPSPSTPVDFTISINGIEDAGIAERWSQQYIQYEEPTRAIISLWIVSIVTSLIAYYFYRRKTD